MNLNHWQDGAWADGSWSAQAWGGVDEGSVEDLEQRYGGGGRRRREEEEAEQVRKQWELLELRRKNQDERAKKTKPELSEIQTPPAPELEPAAIERPRPAKPGPESDVVAAKESLQRALLEAERGAAEQRAAEEELELLQIAMLAVIAVDED